MACTCNPDGLCSCMRQGIQEVNLETQKRAQEDSFSNKQLIQISSEINKALCHYRISDIWIEGFMKGFEEGKSYGD